MTFNASTKALILGCNRTPGTEGFESKEVKGSKGVRTLEILLLAKCEDEDCCRRQDHEEARGLPQLGYCQYDRFAA